MSPRRIFVPIGVAVLAAAGGKRMHPGPSVLRITQDRLREKDFLRSIDVGTTNYREVTSGRDGHSCDRRKRPAAALLPAPGRQA